MRHGRQALLLLIAGMLSLLTAPVRAQEVTRLQAGVVKITATADGERKTGTGFIVKLEPERAYIVTASHVVEGDKNPAVEFSTRRNDPAPATVVFLEGHDLRGLAVLLVRGKDGLPSGLSALSLASSAELNPGDPIESVGFPAGGGAFAYIKGSIVARQAREILFSAPIEEGSSGGPLLKDGRVVGLITQKGAYNHAVPVESVKQFLAGLEIRGVATLDGTRIAYSSNRTGAHQIYLMNPDGTNEVQLTRFKGHNYRPAWSPDGGRIAFASQRDGNWDVMVIGADGSNPVNLTAHPDTDESPTWSPDGAKIAFVSERSGRKQIHVMNADGTGVSAITSGRTWSFDPSWSPDGKRFVFVSEAGGQPGIYVMDVDGSHVTRLSEPGAKEYAPVWSPDGERIAYVGEPDESHIQLFVMNADGSNSRRLVRLPAWAANPSWSPDGSRIVFEYGYQTRREIFVVNADGSKPTQLTDWKGLNSVPAWSPFPR